MGCDIHLYLEYSNFTTQEGEPYWQCHLQNAGGRDYWMFGLLAGVRTDDTPLVAPRGLPEGPLSWEVKKDAFLRITDVPAQADWEGYTTRGQAVSWGETIFKEGEVEYCTHPDWHSHSWLTPDEFAQVLGTYMIKFRESYSVEWDAILAAARTFEEGGAKARLVFWFDN